jgi:hypothetical protein
VSTAPPSALTFATEASTSSLCQNTDEVEGKDWTVSADSTVVRAHQHAAGARRALPADLVTGGTTG